MMWWHKPCGDVVSMNPFVKQTHSIVLMNQYFMMTSICLINNHIYCLKLHAFGFGLYSCFTKAGRPHKRKNDRPMSTNDCADDRNVLYSFLFEINTKQNTHNKTQTLRQFWHMCRKASPDGTVWPSGPQSRNKQLIDQWPDPFIHLLDEIISDG